MRTYPITYSVLLMMMLLWGSSSPAQTLVPDAMAASSFSVDFNPVYIKANRIKNIRYDIIDKKDFQVAEDKDLVQYYEFDTLGRLTRLYYTNIAKTIEKEVHTGPVYRGRRQISPGRMYTKNEYLYDTISTRYFYDSRGDLILKRYNDGTYYESYYYTYDEQHRLTREWRCKETNTSPDRNTFKLGVQTTISDETYQYQALGELQYKKVCINNEGRPYKEVIITLNADKQIININEQYTVAWIVQQYEFKYNAKKQLAEMVFKGNANGSEEVKITYEYDADDCVYTEKQFRKNELLKETSYVTNGLNRRLNSYIARDPFVKSMRIVKLYYTTY